MTGSETAFLVLAEELNFTRAAERLFISQQGLSDHIRKLENQFGTVLFLRRPKVTLTESGRALLDMLNRQKAMEEDLYRKIAEIDAGSTGAVSVGMNASRADFLADRLLEAMGIRYPGVEVRLLLDDTVFLERRLLKGTLDCFIGVNAQPDPRLRIDPLLKEAIVLVLRSDTAEKCGLMPEKCAGSIEAGGVPAGKEAADLRKCADLCFVRNYPGSTLNRMTDRHLEKLGIRLRTPVLVSNYGLQAALCIRRNYAMFCPASVAFAAGGPASSPELSVFPVAGMEETLEISLVTDGGRNYPACANALFDEIRRLVPQLPMH